MPIPSSKPETDGQFAGDAALEPDYLSTAAEIVCAYVSKNKLPFEELPGVLDAVYAALRRKGTTAPEPVVEKPRPAVPVKASVADDFLICLEDGKKVKLLRPYLRTRYGMTPAQYRHRWGLPESYPMVAPNYSLKRAEMAKQIGLGRQRVAQK